MGWIGSRIGVYSLAVGAGLVLLAGVLLLGKNLLLAQETGDQAGYFRVVVPATAGEDGRAGVPKTPSKPQNNEDVQRDREQAKEEARRAEEQAEAEQAAAEQAAADQYAEEYESWREAAAEREEPIPEEAVGTQQESPEQPAPPVGAALSLTVPGAGIYNAPVVDSVAESVLAQGAGKMPGTGFPWQPGANTYIAGHVYGYEGTGSWQLFAGLPNLGIGSEILLTDADGTTYSYQVSEILVVDPTDVWVTSPIPGQTTVSLQTCVGPGWSQRMIVRGVMV